ncbi:MAG: apolipoprotein N-acyltransferase [Elusimicrobiota bacterium]
MRPFTLLVLSALLVSTTFWAGPMGPCFFFGLAPLFLITQRCRPSEAFFKGWLFGTVAWAGGMYWLAGTVSRFLRVPAPVGAAVFLVICAGGGLMAAMPAGGVRWLAPPLEKALGGRPYLAFSLVFVPFLVAVEGYVPAIFPIRFANALQGHLPAVQSVELFGAAGLAALIAGTNASVYVLFHSGFKRWGFAACMAALLACNEGYGFLRIRQVDAQLAGLKPRALKVAILQAAIPIWRKSDPASSRANLESHTALIDEALRRGPMDLIIWPETTYGRDLGYREAWGEPLAPSISGEPFSVQLSKDVPQRAQMLMSALARSVDPATGRRKVYNVAFLRGSGHEFLGLACKRFRMPFGEFMPLGGVFPAFYRWSPRTRRITPGEEQRLLTTQQGIRLGVLICYEDMNAEYARRYAAAGADILVNMTNDAWFGRSQAPEQHLRYACLRAVENRRFLLRAVNTGISAVVDPVGRVRSRLPGGARGVLIDEAIPLQGRTPGSRLGRWPYRLALLLLFVLAWPALLRGGSLAPRAETC